MFCSPALDGTFRCLPSEGGYLDQEFFLMQYFKVIEARIFSRQKRQVDKEKLKTASQNIGNRRVVSTKL